ncbi:MAG TPA: hypothetical protein VER04_18385 [Polyangiaceae bacterium]|nr:hypothetical protein [Polyangiaceae bacterium]
MGNRHHNKQLRAQVRARMAKTGESYQQALSRLSPRPSLGAQTTDVDFLRIDYFGTPLTLATFEILEQVSCVVLPSSGLPSPLPKSPFFALDGRRAVH